MKAPSLVLIAVTLTVVLGDLAVLGQPLHRQKRLSDQRLGELEALTALKKLKGKLVQVPVGYGQINPNDYGRKRRSAPSTNNVREASLLDSLPLEEAGLALEERYDDPNSEGLS